MLIPYHTCLKKSSLLPAGVSTKLVDECLLRSVCPLLRVNVVFLSHLLVAGCDIGVRFSVRPSVRLSTFMSTFNIYVKVSILINYKTKQPSNLA